MKPKPKNKVYCSDSGKPKMLFETEKNANNFIKFNAEEIQAESGYSPKRSYYCTFCGGYHVTSRQSYAGTSRKEQFVEEYKQSKYPKESSKTQWDIRQEFEEQMNGFSDTEKAEFINRSIERRE